MRKTASLILVMICMLCLFGCHGKDKAEVVNTIDGSVRAYHELSDGTWRSEDQIYKYRLEIHGRMSNTAMDTTFVYLSNIEDISFDRAWRAAGLSSFTGDYFSKEEAVLVDWIAK